MRKKSKNKEIIALTAYPPSIDLKTKEDFNSVIIVATYSDDVTRDVTYESSVWVEKPDIIDFQDRIVYPKKAGETKLVAEFLGKKVEVPVKISAPDEIRPVSFKLDVMPVFMKAGCNTVLVTALHADRIVLCSLSSGMIRRVIITESLVNRELGGSILRFQRKACW